MDDIYKQFWTYIQITNDRMKNWNDIRTSNCLVLQSPNEVRGLSSKL